MQDLQQPICQTVAAHIQKEAKKMADTMQQKLKYSDVKRQADKARSRE